ncbi:hypothetical protein [Actinomadura rupiterrae]|uniref:hypothetical protein n=1 Tax=Actinomadura rupiterrae TaxID=559627 RepID=UPI0020A564D4|nr:hypothetical protein [Actinomadura rupiterrae]MCP2341218.1 hypothetical protein [Actinomadura rupiterrae]
MTRFGRPGTAAALALAATALTTPTAHATTGTRTLTCTQTSVTRPAYKRAATGTIDATDTLLSATVTHVATGKVDITTNHPVLDNTFLDGWYLTHNNWNTWRLGIAGTGQYPVYYLLIPATPIPTGTPVNGLVYIDFGPQGGANSFQMTCTAT